ncbi:hypothetical protein QN277_022787 [Acacia crassicarpa]|uniref:Lipoxygenase n=2 Tax=Acacia crassicarpa TaxID=499986 RepID=A0AAE1KAE7_9FABA|nr:hypothetical protein QN277_022787 [Acacia crassicarpa]
MVQNCYRIKTPVETKPPAPEQTDSSPRQSHLAAGAVKEAKRLQQGKIKGTVVLMTKNILDSNNLNLEDKAEDDLGQFLGGAVSLQLISAQNADPGNGLGKLGEAASLEEFVTTLPTLLEGQDAFSVQFDYTHDFGVPGAFVIRNNLPDEFYLVSLTLDDIPNHGSVHYVCNSWIYPANRYSSDRIFFANKAYVPSKTPPALVKYREQELITLRGDGFSELVEHDRVYDYATYNDLGWPDFGESLARPTLGGSSEYPYPRRGRTSRPPSESDPNTESKLHPGVEHLDIYVPRDERFGHPNCSDFLAYFLKLISEDLKPLLEETFNFTSDDFDSFDEVDQLYEGFELPPDVLQNIQKKIPTPMLAELFQTNDELDLIYPLSYPTPKVIIENKSGWMTDEEFAREMLAGVNPGVIRALQELPLNSKLDIRAYGDQTSKITKEQLEQNMGGVTVDEALQHTRLFILDYHDAFMPYLRKINETLKKGYATRTILFLKEDGTLKPLAIELSLPHPDGDECGFISRVVLPADQGVEGTIWLLAKAYVTVNDSGYHQLVSHWLQTHAVIEPFIIAANRQLSVLHPIHKLLYPHFRDTMNINAIARQALLDANGIIEWSFLHGQYWIEMSSKVYKNWVFPDQALPKDLIKRGMAVEDPECPYGLRLVIEDYPFAVDGLEIWAAINTWVYDYVHCYYDSNEDVQQDSELQAWWKEIVEVGHGDLKDQPWWFKMQTRAELVEACTVIIWTSSALHAAVNFGQYPYGGYILNRPTVSRRLLPEDGTPEYEVLKENPEKAFLNTVTPKLMILLHLSVIEILSRHASDEVYLGTRDNPNWTCDVKPLEAFKKFGKRLEEIEKTVIERNNTETLRNRIGPVKMHYTLLYPTSGEGLTCRGIPNSISI